MKMSLLSLSAAACLAVGVGTLASSTVRAEIDYPWCTITALNYGTPDCSYVTIEQCRAAIVGGGGYCQPNPRATVQAPISRRGVR